MNVLEAIKKRKSYRDVFKKEPVPREDLREILEAGTAAPSGCNLQTTQFIAVDEPELVKKIGEIYGRAWAMTAPAAILVLTKYTMAPSGASYHIQDYSAANVKKTFDDPLALRCKRCYTCCDNIID